MKNEYVLLIFIIAIGFLVFGIRKENKESMLTNINNGKEYNEEDIRTIYLAGGCFWGVEEYFDRVEGVVDSISGYANGKTSNPTYQEVSNGNTNHAETVEVKYNIKETTLRNILLYYFKIVDPTILNKQGNDVGTQYRTGIYYTNEDELSIIEEVIKDEQPNYEKEIVVEVEVLDKFYKAEEYHQDYIKKNPSGYCHINLNSAKEDIEGKDIIIKPPVYTKPSLDEIKEKLSDEQYKITQNSYTERAYTHEYNLLDDKGIYVDVVTGEPLFSSINKFDPKTGWPSFTKPIDENYIVKVEDNSLGMRRVEVRSKIGNSHLGHVFNDGPKEDGGYRYCLNGGALKFIAFNDMEKEGYGYLISIFD